MSDRTPSVWLIGENNPYGNDPRYALYPNPFGSAGYRLCYNILGMDEREYLSSFHRRNLLSEEKWSAPKARAAAEELALAIEDFDVEARVVLFGAKVSAAWPGLVKQTVKAFTTPIKNVLVLPHPSGLSRVWNEPGARERARKMIKELAPWLPVTE